MLAHTKSVPERFGTWMPTDTSRVATLQPAGITNVPMLTSALEPAWPLVLRGVTVVSVGTSEVVSAC